MVVADFPRYSSTTSRAEAPSTTIATILAREFDEVADRRPRWRLSRITTGESVERVLRRWHAIVNADLSSSLLNLPRAVRAGPRDLRRAVRGRFPLELASPRR